MQFVLLRLTADDGFVKYNRFIGQRVSIGVGELTPDIYSMC